MLNARNRVGVRAAVGSGSRPGLSWRGLALWVVLLGTAALPAEDDNLRLVTDASPDYSSLPALVHSVTAKWPTAEEKCFAMFYWNHLARRQTAPMMLHGVALTDPIRQFNDYGFTMCSTISGINQSIWEQMGLKHKYWDISNHTVSEVEYGGAYHLYDSSLSAIYTRCDGKTIAGVEEVGKEGSCGLSGGKVELGHIAKYHCLTSTSRRGFLAGADCSRSLDEETNCYNPKALKYRYYYYDWDNGHRYILNLRPHEIYTRSYHSLGDTPGFYVPNQGKDPEAANPRYHLRGNGQWQFTPALTAAGWAQAAYQATGIQAGAGGLQPEKAGVAGQVIYKINSANVATQLALTAQFQRRTAADRAAIAVSTSNGLHWKEVWSAGAEIGAVAARLNLIEEVNGAYEILVRVELTGQAAAADAQLTALQLNTTTELNAKTQPKLNLGKNTIYLDAGAATDSIVFWPELQQNKYKEMVVEESNVAAVKTHNGYEGALYPAREKEAAYIVYRLDGAREIRSLTYGGRFHNRHPTAHIEMLHSVDGKTWTQSWSLTDHEAPWDVIHYETVAIPAGHKSVWVKYVMFTGAAEGPSPCSIYAVRMEAAQAVVDSQFQPIEVTFRWQERQAGGKLVAREHTQTVAKLPCRYTLNVGGVDHPIVDSLTLNLVGARGAVKAGYSDGQDVGGDRFVGTRMTVGENLAVGKKYTLSVPSDTNWEAGDPDGAKLTDGVIGPPYAGGTSYRMGAIWKPKTNPVITLDLGAATECASFGMDIHGYPNWDFMKAEVTDKVEVLVSDDGQQFQSVGFLPMQQLWKDVPVNQMIPDDETLTGRTCRLRPAKPVRTRYVQYRVQSERFFDCTELEVLDRLEVTPFDLKIALPDEN